MRIIIVLLFLLSGFYTSFAQDLTDSTNCKLDKEYFKSLASDFIPLVISPVHWDKKEWISAAAIFGTSAFLYTKDKQIADFWQKNRYDQIDNANKYFFDPLGKMYFTIPLMGAFYLYGTVTNTSKPKRVAMDFVQASLYSGVIVTVMKHIAHRQRPFQTYPHNPYLWDGPFTDNWGHTSFPSGHTIMTFTFAAVVSTHFKDHLWVPISLYSLATLEGMARMYDDKHWSSDVVVGAALGYAIGTFVVNRKHCKLISVPVISSNFTGLAFYYPID